MSSTSYFVAILTLMGFAPNGGVYRECWSSCPEPASASGAAHPPQRNPEPAQRYDCTFGATA